MKKKKFQKVVKQTFNGCRQYLPKDTGQFASRDYSLDFKIKNAEVYWKDRIRATKYGQNAGKHPNLMEILDKGSKAHNIPNAFNNAVNRGVPIGSWWDFGMQGRFNGKFHPGSKKWKGLYEKFFNTFLYDLADNVASSVKGNAIVIIKRGRP